MGPAPSARIRNTSLTASIASSRYQTVAGIRHTPAATAPHAVAALTPRATRMRKDAAFGHHRFEIAVADRVPAVPAHGPKHDLTPEVASLEIAHPPPPQPLAPAYADSSPPVRRNLQQSRSDHRAHRGGPIVPVQAGGGSRVGARLPALVQDPPGWCVKDRIGVEFGHSVLLAERSITPPPPLYTIGRSEGSVTPESLCRCTTLRPVPQSPNSS